MRRHALLGLIALAGCGGGDAPEAALVYKYRGSVQCGTQGTSPAAMGVELTNAGITVFSATCGSDGLIHAAACGISDGIINIFEIPASQVAAAQSLSFALLSALPDATQLPSCP